MTSLTSPADILNSKNFVTGYDGPINADYRAAQYRKGKSIPAEKPGRGKLILSAELCWSFAWSPEGGGGVIHSYERIGYHAGTAELLQGFLDSGCRIEVYMLGASIPTVVRE